MIDFVFSAYALSLASIFREHGAIWRFQSSANMAPYGDFKTSFKDAFEVVRSLRSQGYRAVVKVTNPNYTIYPRR